MKIKNKILAILLVFAFVMSVSCVFAEDSADVSNELSAADNEAISASDDESLSASQDESALAASSDSEDTLEASDEVASDAPSSDADKKISDYTKGAVKIEVLNHNYKVGDKVKVRFTVSNLGPYDAEDVKVGFGFLDEYENPDFSLKFMDDGKYDVSRYDTGYYLNFGFLGKGATKSVVLTFLATEPGEKTVQGGLEGDHFSNDVYDNDTFTVTESSNSNSNSVKKAAGVATSIPAGNPIALLLLSVLSIVPYCLRR